MTAKEHYDQHLGNIYSWMVGDFDVKCKEFQEFLMENNLAPKGDWVAIDLGAGHGVQSIALRKLGYSVIAIDFNRQLLAELKRNADGEPIEIVEDDIREIRKYSALNPDLILCCGDTITHLESVREIETFIGDCAESLSNKGQLMLSWRDYSRELSGVERFIPVRSDSERILTCFLEYGAGKVTVTDLLHERTQNGWVQKASSYSKVRLKVADVVQMIERKGMRIRFNEAVRGLKTIIAQH